MSRPSFPTITALACINTLCLAQDYAVSSPDGKVRGEVRLVEGQLRYQVSYDNHPLISESVLGIRLDTPGQDFTTDLTVTAATTSEIDDAYVASTGKRSHRRYHAKALTLSVQNAAGNPLDLIVQASNHGFAFRYRLHNSSTGLVLQERSEFTLPVDASCWIMQDQDVYGNYEKYYDHHRVGALASGRYLLPGLFELPQGHWMLFSDAAVFANYAAVRLRHEGAGRFAVALPDRGDWSLIRAEANLVTPWRAMIIGDTPGRILESTLIEDLNPPTQVQDLSWIKPGVTAFPWWDDFWANDKPEVLKQYIDLAAELGWEYVEFDLACIGWDFQKNKENKNAWRTAAHVPEVIRYARDKGVGLWGWDTRKNMSTLAEAREIFTTNKALGLVGIKIDFVNDDSQIGMQFRTMVLEEAARQQMMVSFHGDISPRGMARTYPFMMTQEGVLGNEYYKLQDWTKSMGKTTILDTANPIHASTLPYTRNVVGSMDFTPVALSDLRRTGTYAHELAQAITTESGWLVMCDRPSAYLTSPAKAFLQELVAAWDDTKALDGYPGRYCVLARRHGADWFVAGINAGDAREVAIPLDFIKPGRYPILVYGDGPEAHATCSVTPMTVLAGETLLLTMATNGGFAFILHDAQ